MQALLDDCNKYWMRQLPRLMKEQCLFVSVGALRSVGKTDLVQQLGRKGLIVTHVNLEDK